jgi:hypothetical protein
MSREDIDNLLNLCLGFADEMLAKHGEFYPFGAKINAEGESDMVQGLMGEERPSEEQLISLTLAGLRNEAERGGIRASALCVNVTLSRPDGRTDAIRVMLEDASEAMYAFLPYKIGFGRRVKYGELEVSRAQPHQVFVPKPE